MKWLNGFWSYLCGCSHLWGWPTRRPDGQDWQTCVGCGRERLSSVQFERSQLKRLMPLKPVVVQGKRKYNG